MVINIKKKINHPEPSMANFQKIIDLRQFENLKLNKLVFIKVFAKYHGIKVSGTKPVLIDRIELFFKKQISAIIIQKNIRGFFVRFSFKIRGLGFYNRSLCVNDTDFYTLEPLGEISFENFFSYTDEKNFTFGFDIQSLLTLFIKSGKIVNPYNRDTLHLSVITDIFSLYGIIQSIFKYNLYVKYCLPKNTYFKKENILIQNVLINNANDIRSNSFVDIITVTEIEIFLREIKNKPILTRIDDCFTEIDNLGNYTSSNWITELSYDHLYTLYWYYNSVWNLGFIMSEVKERLFPFGNPIVPYNTILNRGGILNLCVTIIENLIFSAIDSDDRKLGAIHVISGLTIVSNNARHAYSWLYDSAVHVIDQITN